MNTRDMLDITYAFKKASTLRLLQTLSLTFLINQQGRILDR
jgi:hypothetical protein